MVKIILDKWQNKLLFKCISDLVVQLQNTSETMIINHLTEIVHSTNQNEECNFNTFEMLKNGGTEEILISSGGLDSFLKLIL